MKRQTLRGLLRAAAFASLLPASHSASAAEFHPIQDVTSATSDFDFYDVYNLIEGPDIGFNPEAPYERLSGLTWVTNDANTATGQYFDPLPDPAPKLVFDLGENARLTEISVWGYATGIEGNSLKDFSLKFATAAEGPEGAGTSITSNPTFSAGPQITRQSFLLGQAVMARYVELTPLSNNVGLGPGGDRVGFSEAAFEIIPEVNGSRADLLTTTVALGNSSNIKPFTVTVRNLGTQPLTLTGATFTGAGAGAYSVVNVPASLPPYSQALLQLQYSPVGQTPGDFAATFTVNTNDGANPVLEVPVTATLPAAAPDEFYPIAGATSTTDESDHFKVSGLIQGIGVGFNPEQPHNQLGGAALWVTTDPNGNTGDYFDPLNEPAPVLVMDLGADVPLGEISVWGYSAGNANGASDFKLRFATAAEGDAGFGGSITYSPTFTAAFGYDARQSFDFSQVVTARYVEITLLDNYFQSARNAAGTIVPGGDRVGLGEVAFEKITPVTGKSLTVSETADFGVITETKTAVVTLRNYGSETVTISSTAFTGPNAAALSVKSAPATLPPLSQAQVEIEFNAEGFAEGPVSATLQINNDAAAAAVAITGRYYGPDDEFYPIQSVTSATSDTDLYAVERLIQGSDIGFQATQPHNQYLGGENFLWVTDAPNGAGNFFDPEPEPGALLTFDLGEDVPLSEISVWGYSTGNSNGLRDFTLAFATSAEGAEAAGTSISYKPAFTVPFGELERHSFPFSQTVTARYVVLDPVNNWGGQDVAPGGDRVGLGEVAFQAGAVVAPPAGNFAITAVGIPAAGQVKITFISEAGVNYTVSRSTDLTTWSPVGTVAGAAGSTDFTDTAVPNNTGKIFYRVTR